MTSSVDQVTAVVVSYEPTFQVLDELLDTLSRQVKAIAVVDNGSRQDVRGHLAERGQANVHCIALAENKGVAAAQNVGIEWARNRGAAYVLLLDHDSIPAPDMVRRLVEAVEAMRNAGRMVAAVGPRYVDERQNNPPPFIRVRGLAVERARCDDPEAIVPVDYLISSGCLIPVAALDAVGGMHEALFIDYVDIEWGLRARSKGYQCFGVCAAAMRHTLGDSPIEFFGRKIPLHSPLRHYYHFRNAVWLYRQRWLPRNWKLADGWRLLAKYVFYSLLARPRMAHWRMMTLGVWHGLRGRLGRFDPGSS